MHFGRFLDENGLMPAPDVFGFNSGIILLELAYLNLNRTSESVSSMSNMIDGLVC